MLGEYLTRNNLVFPTPVGINRTYALLLYASITCSPHLWGLTARGMRIRGYGNVFPTPVGINRICRWWVGLSGCVPHTCGD